MKYKMYDGKIVPTESKILSEARKTGFNGLQTSLNLGRASSWISNRLGRDASLRKKYKSAKGQYLIELEERALRESEKTGFSDVQTSLNLGRGATWVSDRWYNSKSFRLTYNKAKEEYEGRYA